MATKLELSEARIEAAELGDQTAIIELWLQKEYGLELAERGYRIVRAVPDQASLEAGARAIGETRGLPNHIERARQCWAAMVAA